jgi:hypothetical protein
VSNLEWDVYMSILRDRSDDPSVWARKKLQQMADRIHALTAERDRARQMYCNAMTDHCEEHEARQIAQEQGWDCFKEDGK